MVAPNPSPSHRRIQLSDKAHDPTHNHDVPVFRFGAEVGTPPPTNDEAERCLIGCLLKSAAFTLKTAERVVGVEDLHAHEAKVTWTAAHALYARGKCEADPTLEEIVAELRRREALSDEITAYIASAHESVVGVSNAAHWAKAVRKAADQRRARELAMRVQSAAHTEDYDGVEALVTRYALERDAARAEMIAPPQIAWHTGEEITRWADEHEERFLWHGVVAVGSVTLFAALPKAGKSTLLWAWLGAISRGEPWMGEPAPATRALVVTEENRYRIAEKVRRFGIDADHVLIVTREDLIPPPSWPDLVRLAADKAKEVGAEILIFDTLGHYAGFRDEDENNAARVMEAFAPLQAAAAKGLAPIVVHHGNKKQGEHMTSIRGSTAFHAVPDAVVEVRFFAEPDDPKRTLRVSGRLEDHAAPVVVELKRPEGGPHYVEMIGGVNDAQIARAKDTILEALGRGPEWWTKEELEV
jgi:hypothetical protein